jgi:Domain of unknown function (DUF4105)
MMRFALAILALGLGAWGAAALWYAGPGAAWLRGALAAALVLAALLVVAAVRPVSRAALALAALALLVFAWWGSLTPSNTRDWQVDVAREPTAEIAGDRVTVRNVRNFVYRSETDFDERWEERRLDLAKLDGLDMFFSFWGSPLIAHTIMSWSFSDGQHLAVSIETRKEKSEVYSPVAGFFRQYELIYLAADERDVVKLRTNYRNEDVYVYRLRPTKQRAKAFLLDYLGAMNELAAEPGWYNALTTNCTTTIRQRVMHAGGQVPFSWKLLANGYLPELLYERGSFDHSLPFAELKTLSHINERAHAVGDGADFSAAIRAGLPMPPLTD